MKSVGSWSLREVCIERTELGLKAQARASIEKTGPDRCISECFGGRPEWGVWTLTIVVGREETFVRGQARVGEGSHGLGSQRGILGIS